MAYSRGLSSPVGELRLATTIRIRIEFYPIKDVGSKPSINLHKRRECYLRNWQGIRTFKRDAQKGRTLKRKSGRS